MDLARRMDFVNRICPNCKNPNYVVLLGDSSKIYEYKCMNCNRYFNDIDFEKEPLQPVWKSKCMNTKVDEEAKRMPDREKAIKGLECCLKESDHLYSNPCKGCPYLTVLLEEQGCVDRMKADALALLKEQEAVEPINSYGTFRCGNCRNIVGYNDGNECGYQNNFCSKCGRAVKWNE